DEQDGQLTLVWDDGRTRYTLGMPYENARPVRLVAEDRRGLGQLAQREREALALDRKERLDRLATGRPLLRLPRNLDQIELGMAQAQVQQLLPAGGSLLKRPLADGLAVTLIADPTSTQVSVLRQLFIRFNNKGLV